MYEEGNRKLSFNWGSLIVKLVILAVIVLLICFIITRFTNRSDNNNSLVAMENSEYIDNINLMKTAAIEHFTVNNLPQDIGESEKLTLKQMIDQKLLIDFTNNGQVCDVDTSYVQTTKTADGNYALKVSLDCGDKSDFIVTTIEVDYVDDDQEEVTPPADNNNNNNTNNSGSDNNNSNTNNNNNSNNSSNNNNNNNSSNNNSGSSGSNTTVTIKVYCTAFKCYTSKEELENDKNNNNDKPTVEKTRYYKLYKWSEWQTGTSDKAGDENKKVTTTTYNYCKNNTKTYYATGYVSEGSPDNRLYAYELQLLDLDPNIDIDSIKISNASYFSSSDYFNYMSNYKNVYITNNPEIYNLYINNAAALKNSALNNYQYSFSVGNIYKSNGIYKTLVTVDYKNHAGISSYYANTLGKYIYFTPIKFNVSYTSDCIRDTYANKDKYQGYTMSDPECTTTYMYRTKEYIWSTSKTKEGYTYTGIYEDR